MQASRRLGRLNFKDFKEPLSVENWQFFQVEIRESVCVILVTKCRNDNEWNVQHFWYFYETKLQSESF